MSSIFTKIIDGSVKSHIIYQDRDVAAFLDIDQSSPGHILIVPRVEIDKFYDLSEAEFTKLMSVAWRFAKKLEKATGLRTLLKIIGTDVPHAHIHLFPIDGNNKLTGKTADEIQEILK